MTRDEFKAQVKRFMDSFLTLLDKYEEANPEWMTITLLQVIYKAIARLKDLIENPEEKEITWENPFAELRYPVQANWEKVEPRFFTLTEEDFKAEDRLPEKFVEGFITVKELYIFRLLTKDILMVIDKEKLGYKLPVDLNKKIAGLPKERQAEKIERMITKPVNLINLIFRVGPCVLNVDEKTAYYPILIGLDFTGFKAKDLDEEARAEVWKRLLEEFKGAIPKENLDFLERPRPEVTVKPVSKEVSLVKVGLHAELRKFGPGNIQPEVFNSLLDETKKEIIEKKIEVVGLDLTQAQNQALFTIQKILSETNYRGNINGRYIESYNFKFNGYLPLLKFTPAQYLEAYGVPKYKTARGKEEFDGKARANALRALADLAKKSFLFVYKRKYFIVNDKGKRKERIDRIETISPLLRIIRGWEALTKYEDRMLDKGQSTEAIDEKIKAIIIEPAPILVQDIDSYFVLKPANYIQEIKLLYPWPAKPSKFIFRFIEWLIVQAELKRRHNRPLVIERNYEEIARILKMDDHIKNRRYKMIKHILNDCYRTAKELGYLLNYCTIQGQTKELERLELNPEKFKKIREFKAKLG